MKKNGRIIWFSKPLLLIFTALVVGCASSPSLRVIDPILEIKSANNANENLTWWENLSSRYGRDTRRIRCTKESYELLEGYINSQSAECNYVNSTLTVIGVKGLRSRFAHEILPIVDEYHENYKNELRMNFSTTNFIFDFSILGLNALGTVLGGDTTKAALAAAAAGLGGTKLAINEHYFQEKTLTAIVNQMDALRAKEKMMILKKLHNHNVSEYPLSAVEYDLLVYFYSASLVNAFAAIAEDSADSKAIEETNLSYAEISGQYVDSNKRECLKNWVAINRSSHIGRLQSWLSTKGLVVPAGYWIRSDTADEQHITEAIASLAINCDDNGVADGS